MNIHNFGNEPEKNFHSNAYAEAAHGTSIGSTSSQTFGQRYHVERNRNSVRSYRESHIGQGSMNHYARRAIPDPVGRLDASAASSTRGQTGSAYPSASSRTDTSRFNTPTARTGFREPPARYNPYA